MAPKTTSYSFFRHRIYLVYNLTLSSSPSLPPSSTETLQPSAFVQTNPLRISQYNCSFKLRSSKMETFTSTNILHLLILACSFYPISVWSLSFLYHLLVCLSLFLLLPFLCLSFPQQVSSSLRLASRLLCSVMLATKYGLGWIGRYLMEFRSLWCKIIPSNMFSLSRKFF